MPGAYAGVLKGVEAAKTVGLEFQINTTITRLNLKEIPQIQELVKQLGAVAHHIFMLVPTGRGRSLTEQTISAEEYEQTLTGLVKRKDEFPLPIKATCAPHYYRILRELARQEGKEITPKTHGLDALTRGCLGGTGFCFISHRGQVQPCGYLEIEAGNVRKETFQNHLGKLAGLFGPAGQIQYQGKCGQCEYFRVCGGCRARAFAATGNYLAEEPLCRYQPRKQATGNRLPRAFY